MDELRKLLDVECDYRMADDTMDRFLGLMTEVRLKNNEPLIPYGKTDKNIYVVKEGIIRLAYFDGSKEMTFSFATPGTLLISWHSYYALVPSIFQLESCGKSVIMKVTKAQFDELLSESYDFTSWMLRMSMAQFWFHEMKLALINGATAKERFEALLKNRPEIIQKVSSKIVASYIGIIPSSLSRLKRELMPSSKK